jgi:hypothetical protein
LHHPLAAQGRVVAKAAPMSTPKPKAPDYDWQITCELEEFRKDYGDPAGQLFTLEITSNATTYFYANVAGEVHSGQVVFNLSSDALVGTRKSH